MCFNDPGVAEFGLHNALLSRRRSVHRGRLPHRGQHRRGPTARPEECLRHRLHGDVRGRRPRRREWMRSTARRSARCGAATSRQSAAVTCTRPTSAVQSSVSTRPTPPGSWLWGGPTWTAHTDNSTVTSIAGYTIAAEDPGAVTTLWSLFGLLHGVEFVEGTTSDIDLLTATDRSAVGTGSRSIRSPSGSSNTASANVRRPRMERVASSMMRFTRCMATDEPTGIASTELTASAPVTVSTQRMASAGGSARISARVTVP